MAFLSLARGDSQARALLQRAIRARYGVRPLLVESVRIEMTGKSKGPLGFPLKATVLAAVRAAGHEPIDLGTFSAESVDYPDYAVKVGEAIRA